MLENLSVGVEIRIVKVQTFSGVIFSCDFKQGGTDLLLF